MSVGGNLSVRRRWRMCDGEEEDECQGERRWRRCDGEEGGMSARGGGGVMRRRGMMSVRRGGG